MFVIKRTDGAGGYVAKPGNSKSYTSYVHQMQKFATRDEAQRHCCENEVVVDLNQLLQ